MLEFQELTDLSFETMSQFIGMVVMVERDHVQVAGTLQRVQYKPKAGVVKVLLSGEFAAIASTQTKVYIGKTPETGPL